MIVKIDQHYLNPKQVVHHKLVNHHNHRIQLKMLNHLIELSHFVQNEKVLVLQYHHKVIDQKLELFYCLEQVLKIRLYNNNDRKEHFDCDNHHHLVL